MWETTNEGSEKRQRKDHHFFPGALIRNIASYFIANCRFRSSFADGQSSMLACDKPPVARSFGIVSSSTPAGFPDLIPIGFGPLALK
jgi:hypothetical protein